MHYINLNRLVRYVQKFILRSDLKSYVYNLIIYVVKKFKIKL